MAYFSAKSGLLCGMGLRYNPKATLGYGAYRGRLCRLCVLSFIMQKVLRATSYSTVAYSAWSRACDPCMFAPEKISPDSLLEGEYMLDGMFVFFICSLSLHRLFLHPFPSLLCSFYDDSIFSLSFSVWSPSPIYMSVPSSDFSPSHSALLFVSVSLLLLSHHRVSALCPVGEESRLGPSSVSGKVALQLAACLTRGPSLLGLATHTSAPLLLRLWHTTPAMSQLLDQQWKVKSSEGKRQIQLVYFACNHDRTLLCGVCIPWFWVALTLLDEFIP